MSGTAGAADAPSRRSAVSEYFSAHARSWRERYDAHEDFDAYNYLERGDVALRWLDDVRARGGSRLLELGCGAGVQAARAAARGWEVVASDLSVDMLLQGRAEGGALPRVAAAVEALPFRSGAFDAVMMLGVIGYVADPAELLARLRDQLRPKGALVVSWASAEPTLLDAASAALSRVPDALYSRARRAVDPRWRPWTPEQEPSFFDRFNRFWSEREFLRVLADAGFGVERVRGINFGRLRFMGRAPWSHRTDIRVSRALERVAPHVPFESLRARTRTHVALATAR